MEKVQAQNAHAAALDMPPEEFRRLGYQVVDRLADFLTSLPGRPVTPGETRQALQAALGGGSVPAQGTEPERLLEEAATLLFEHSLLNGHPRFWGYITSSAASIGALGDLLAAAVNPNVGAGILSPTATEIEAQTVRWIAELIGCPSDCGGLLTSGSNIANFIGLIAAHPELEAYTQALSITTFRYIPPGLQPGSEDVETYLNHLNAELVTQLQQGGKVFVSNAVIEGKYLLRACIVNFRTSLADVVALPGVVAHLGREINARLRPTAFTKQESLDDQLR